MEDDGLTAEERAKVEEIQKKLTPFQPTATARAAALGGGGADLMASLRGEEKEDEDGAELTEAEKRLAAIRKRMVQRKREAQRVSMRRCKWGWGRAPLGAPLFFVWQGCRQLLCAYTRLLLWHVVSG